MLMCGQTMIGLVVMGRPLWREGGSLCY